VDKNEYIDLFHKLKLNLVAFKPLFRCDDEVLTLVNAAEEKAYEQGFVDGVKKNSESRVSKFMDTTPLLEIHRGMVKAEYNESGQLIELHPKWVGLTNEEFKQCSYDANGFMIDREVAMRAVESKLKEKNK